VLVRASGNGVPTPNFEGGSGGKEEGLPISPGVEEDEKDATEKALLPSCLELDSSSSSDLWPLGGTSASCGDEREESDSLITAPATARAMSGSGRTKSSKEFVTNTPKEYFTKGDGKKRCDEEKERSLGGSSR
jgi:hypothetical protein